MKQTVSTETLEHSDARALLFVALAIQDKRPDFVPSLLRKPTADRPTYSIDFVSDSEDLSTVMEGLRRFLQENAEAAISAIEEIKTLARKENFNER